MHHDLIDEEKTEGSINMVLQEDSENTMDGSRKQREKFKENNGTKRIFIVSIRKGELKFLGDLRGKRAMEIWQSRD